MGLLSMKHRLGRLDKDEGFDQEKEGVQLGFHGDTMVMYKQYHTF